jgi:hypothetical protein
MKIHGNITGRMTNIAPSLQPNKEPLGIPMLEMDFKQLEERVAAYYVRDNNEQRSKRQKPYIPKNSNNSID